MPLPRRFVSTAVFAALALSGCGASPTAPNAPVSSLDSPGASPSAVTRIADDGPEAIPVAITGSATLKGQNGGTVTAGAFTLVVPPGAYSGNATITLTQPDPLRMEVELDVQPASKNAFTRNATLIANLSSWSWPQVRRAAIYALDPATGAYVPVPSSTVDPTLKRVRAGFAKLASSRVKSN